MLIEVKVKVSRIVDNKARKVTNTFLIDCEFFSGAEYAVSSLLTEEQQSGLVENFEIQSLKISPIKEIATQYMQEDEETFLITMRDTWLSDDGTEKHLKYKILLWAANLTEANHRAHEISREGYDMAVEEIKQAEYIYLHEEGSAE